MFPWKIENRKNKTPEHYRNAVRRPSKFGNALPGCSVTICQAKQEARRLSQVWWKSIFFESICRNHTVWWIQSRWFPYILITILRRFYDLQIIAVSIANKNILISTSNLQCMSQLCSFWNETMRIFQSVPSKNLRYFWLFQIPNLNGRNLFFRNESIRSRLARYLTKHQHRLWITDTLWFERRSHGTTSAGKEGIPHCRLPGYSTFHFSVTGLPSNSESCCFSARLELVVEGWPWRLSCSPAEEQLL